MTATLRTQTIADAETIADLMAEGIDDALAAMPHSGS